MPARVHALLVVRPDGRVPADLHLRRTLAALSAQTRAVDALTIVICGEDERTRRIAAESRAEAVIGAGRTTTYAQALRIAGHRLRGDAVWLLAQDTAPEPNALARLAGALEAAPSMAFAAPKLVRWDDRSRLVSLGISMTRFGRSVVLAAGELDQGQYDGGEDVLAADVRGILVRTDVWRDLDGLDHALGGADEGLDLGVRARLAGHRVALAPAAVVAVAGDGVAAPPAGDDLRERLHRISVERTAQLHRRLAYAPASAVLLHWLSLLPLALWRIVVDLVAKRPLRIGPDVAASVVVLVRLGALVRARRRIRRAKRRSWSLLAPLRITRAGLSSRLLDATHTVGEGREELRFFSGGGAWTVLAFALVSVVTLPGLLAWPALGGGALLPLRPTVAGLWADAAFGPRPIGWALSGPADPFSLVVALLGSLSPASPSRAIVVLWLLALPVAALGGWFAATRLTTRSGLRIVVASMWALAPTLLTALADGRPAAVIVHLALPWLLFTAAVAHRSWASAAAGSLLVALVLACAPSLAPALACLWIVALVLVAVHGARGFARVCWLIVPAVVVFWPLGLERWRTGDLWALLADPGAVGAGDTATDGSLAALALRLAGFPTPDAAGWQLLLPEGMPLWVLALVAAPVALLAAASVFARRALPAMVLVLMATTGLLTAVFADAVVVSAVEGVAVPLFAAPALSLAWAGLVGAAVVALDRLPMPSPARVTASALMLSVVVVAAVAPLSASLRDASGLTNGPTSTLPAYVAAEGGGGRSEGTLVLTPLADGSMSSRVVWGGTESLGGASTLSSARTGVVDDDAVLARLTADLVTSSAAQSTDDLAAHGIGFVLVEIPADESDAARAIRLESINNLNQRDGLDNVGEAGDRVLWRIAVDVDERAATAAQQRVQAGIALWQLAVVAVCLLLAVPTAETRADARRRSRIVGAGGRA